VATGDKFIAEKTEQDRVVNLFGASACEMEGGSIGHTAFVNGTPFIVVRAISYSADGDAGMDYATFLPLATNISTALTLELVRKY
jgi:adenosylhomocysteine nucleosidase